MTVIAFFTGLLAGESALLIIIGIALLVLSIWASGRMAGQQLVTRRSKAQARLLDIGGILGAGLLFIGLLPTIESGLKDLGLIGNIVLAVCVLMLLSFMGLKKWKSRVKKAA